VTVLADVSAHSQTAPPPPPATWDAYSKKSGESTGAIAMMDLLIKDLTNEMTEGKKMEADSQADYEEMMRDSADKRVTDTQTLADRGAAKAGLESDLAAAKGEKTSTEGELAATLEYISSLHSECDWLLKYFDVRKEARNGEIDSLVNAKAVLSGADYSLIQASSAMRTGRACPNTAVSLTATANAAGTPVFGEAAAGDGVCVSAGSAINAIKFCGPGELLISRMTCDKHNEYKSETISHSGAAWTKGQCEVVSLAGTVADGHLGSYTLSC
jgi:hypothetical protein